jgi:hypothetical protein
VLHRPKIEVNKGSLEQGIKELKKSWVINKSQIVLGAGGYGKVFLSKSVYNDDTVIAIKTINKQKLQDNL